MKCDVPKTPSTTGEGSLMILIDLQMKLFAICRVLTDARRRTNNSLESSRVSSTKVGLGKGFSAVTRIARPLRESDLQELVATSSSVVYPLVQ